MPVNFFAKPCSNLKGNCQAEQFQCLQNITSNTFGISDIDGVNRLPAKVNVLNPNPETDFIVVNSSNTGIIFKAVDWCVDIYRTGTYSFDDENRDVAQFSSDSVKLPESELIKRCEGFLQFQNSILFIEIKNRHKGRGWIKDAREKFEETILSFKEHHPTLAGKIVKPILSNPSFRGLHQNETIQKKMMKDKVGVEFDRLNCLEI